MNMRADVMNAMQMLSTLLGTMLWRSILTGRSVAKIGISA